MSWATNYVSVIKRDGFVKFRPRGNSMSGKIESGQLVTVRGLNDNEVISVGDIVLCKVSGRHYLHLISAISGDRFQISNNKGHINGWIGIEQIYGKCISVE